MPHGFELELVHNNSTTIPYPINCKLPRLKCLMFIFPICSKNAFKGNYVSFTMPLFNFLPRLRLATWFATCLQFSETCNKIKFTALLV